LRFAYRVILCVGRLYDGYARLPARSRPESAQNGRSGGTGPRIQCIRKETRDTGCHDEETSWHSKGVSLVRWTFGRLRQGNGNGHLPHQAEHGRPYRAFPRCRDEAARRGSCRIGAQYMLACGSRYKTGAGCCQSTWQHQDLGAFGQNTPDKSLAGIAPLIYRTNTSDRLGRSPGRSPRLWRHLRKRLAIAPVQDLRNVFAGRSQFHDRLIRYYGFTLNTGQPQPSWVGLCPALQAGPPLPD
jgi:hypothetical protein